MALHKSISDYHRTFHHNQPQIRIHLGDYVDRGPDSFEAVKYIRNMERTAPFQVVSLKGNHESMMLNAYDSNRAGALDTWLDNGGHATVLSYENHGYDMPPKSHLDWIRHLPTRYFDQQRGLVFVHAGIDPQAFPHESDAVQLWTRREDFFDTKMWSSPALAQIRVIHGHTPTASNRPDMTKDGRRINIDTGACFGGALSAVVLAPNEKPLFLYA